MRSASQLFDLQLLLRPRTDLSLSDGRIDLVRDAVDLAVRLGPLDDSTVQRTLIRVIALLATTDEERDTRLAS